MDKNTKVWNKTCNFLDYSLGLQEFKNIYQDEQTKFEVLTAVLIKISLQYNIPPCRLVYRFRCCRGYYCLQTHYRPPVQGTLKMLEACASDMLTTIHLPTRHGILEQSYLQEMCDYQKNVSLQTSNVSREVKKMDAVLHTYCRKKLRSSQKEMERRIFRREIRQQVLSIRQLRNKFILINYT